MHFVKRRVTGFRKDDAGDWIADLDCGHKRHVRHNPPWVNHAWIISPDGRAAFLGNEIDCGECSQQQQEWDGTFGSGIAL
jgi:hypothetical protein